MAHARSAQLWMSAAVVAIGLLLMAMMIYQESEPGALPLALVAGGLLWHGIARWRLRAPR